MDLNSDQLFGAGLNVRSPGTQNQPFLYIYLLTIIRTCTVIYMHHKINQTQVTQIYHMDNLDISTLSQRKHVTRILPFPIAASITTHLLWLNHRHWKEEFLQFLQGICLRKGFTLGPQRLRHGLKSPKDGTFRPLYVLYIQKRLAITYFLTFKIISVLLQRSNSQLFFGRAATYI